MKEGGRKLGPGRVVRTQNIVTKLRELQTHHPKLLLRLRPERMTPRRPEIRHRRPDRRVVLLRVRINVPRVRDLALSRAVHTVDLRGRQALERRQRQHLAERVDARVLEELVACLVNAGDGRVDFELAAAGQPAWEVVACVEEFEEAADGLDVLVYQVDSGVLWAKLASLI